MTTTARNPLRENGLCQVELRLHMAGIAQLIELCFGHKLDSTAQRAMREMHMLSRIGPLLWLLGLISDSGSNWQHGFVFLHDGRVVGSVGAQPSDSGPKTYLIANLAVHPDFRRQGIARQLMLAALSKAARHGARCVVLQVNEDNGEAIPLYEELGFDALTTRTTWERTKHSIPDRVKTGYNIHVRPANRMDWLEELALLEEFRSAGLFWTDPFRVDRIKPSLWRNISNMLNARSEERWIAFDSGKVIGWFQIMYRVDLSHQIRLIVRPEHRRELEQLLLVKALRRLSQRQRHVRIEHPKGESETLLTQYEFRPIGTLLWMHKSVA